MRCDFDHAATVLALKLLSDGLVANGLQFSAPSTNPCNRHGFAPSRKSNDPDVGSGTVVIALQLGSSIFSKIEP